jgi:hypothetical protein
LEIRTNRLEANVTDRMSGAAKEAARRMAECCQVRIDVEPLWEVAPVGGLALHITSCAYVELEPDDVELLEGDPAGALLCIPEWNIGPGETATGKAIPLAEIEAVLVPSGVPGLAEVLDSIDTPTGLYGSLLSGGRTHETRLAECMLSDARGELALFVMDASAAASWSHVEGALERALSSVLWVPAQLSCLVACAPILYDPMQQVLKRRHRVLWRSIGMRPVTRQIWALPDLKALSSGWLEPLPAVDAAPIQSLADWRSRGSGRKR